MYILHIGGVYVFKYVYAFECRVLEVYMCTYVCTYSRHVYTKACVLMNTRMHMCCCINKRMHMC